MSILTFNAVFILNMFIQFLSYSIILSSIIYIKKIRMFLFAIICAIISGIISCILPTALLYFIIPCNLLIGMVVCKLIFKIDLFKSVYFSIIGITVYTISDLLSLIFFMNFNNSILLSQNQMLTLSIVFTLKSTFIFLSTTVLSKKVSSLNILKVIDLYNVNDLKKISLFMILLAIVITPNQTIFHIQSNLNFSISCFIVLIKLFLLAISWKMLSNNKQLFKMKLELKNCKIENKNMQIMIDKIRIFKHDYNNTMASIAGYISMNDMSGLKRYFSRISNEIEEINLLQSINPHTINEPSIFSIIYSKYKEAMHSQIKFNFYSTLDYQNLNMPIYDFSKILGIFLDNAIYNAGLSKEKEIYLSLELKKNNMQVITIKNSYINKDIDTNIIFEKGFSTKNVKSGLGLWEVKGILKNLDFIDLYTTKDEDYFVQTLIIMPQNAKVASL